MNLSTVKLLVSGMLLLFLNACAPYHPSYYPSGGGYGVTQRSYYGGYDNRSYPYYSIYRYDYHDSHSYIDHHDGYNSRASRDNVSLKPNSPNNYSHNYPDRKHQQFSYRGSVPAYPDPKDHRDPRSNNSRNKHPSDRRWEHNNDHERSNLDAQYYGQNHGSDDRKSQLRKQRHYGHENDRHRRYENHEQLESRPGNHQRPGGNEPIHEE